jgi:hypothetical protein
VGQLDEKSFAAAIARCTKCDTRAFEVASYIDRQHSVMLGAADDDGRWAYDGEKLIDGVFRVRCLACSAVAFSSDDCPRCHRANGLADALGRMSKLTVPKRCPGCRGTELIAVGFAPATVRTGATRPPWPTPTAVFGEVGFHVAAISCDGCDWTAVAEGCPLCGGPGPLRARP